LSVFSRPLSGGRVAVLELRCVLNTLTADNARSLPPDLIRWSGDDFHAWW
jgi:hypothetical protein